MPKFSKPATQPATQDALQLPSRTFVLDNGGFTTKAGFAPAWPSSDPDTLRNCHVTQNSLVRTRNKRVYVASEQDDITQWSEAIFRRPVERGQLVSWEAEKAIWEHSFFDEKTAHRDLLIKEPAETTLILTETPNTIQALQRNADEIIMEEWGFGGYARVIGPSLNAYHDLRSLFGDDTDTERAWDVVPQPQECLLVVDSGYSHTTITPLYRGVPIHRAIRRLDVGGKHLTNYLKEVVSIRYFDLQQDTKIVNDIKEDVCFVSTDFNHDMERTWKGNVSKRRKSEISASSRSNISDLNEEKENTANDQPPTAKSLPVDDPDQSLSIDYILPDGFKVHRGFARPHNPNGRRREKQKPKRHLPKDDNNDDDDDADQISMTLACERFTIPEILFNPSDIRSQQPGIAHAVTQSLSVLPPALQATFLSNILLVGGNARMPNMAHRLQDEVRMLAPAAYQVRVRAGAVSPPPPRAAGPGAGPGDPVTSTWLGGARMAANPDAVRRIGVTREEYAEYGSAWVGRRFAMAGRGG